MFLDLFSDLGPHQKYVIVFSLTDFTSFHQVSWKSILLFLCNLSYKQTNKQKRGENITSFADVKMCSRALHRFSTAFHSAWAAMQIIKFHFFIFIYFQLLNRLLPVKKSLKSTSPDG